MSTHFFYPQICGSEVIEVELKEAITDRILSLCQQRGISVNKLCNMSGVTQSTVNNIINRKNNTTTVSTIKKLCDGLDISLRAFFDTPAFDELEQELK